MADLERARAELAAGRTGQALETLDAVLWSAVGRLDWPVVAAVEQLLTEIWPSADGRGRRRCEYLLHAARQNLRAHTDHGAGESEASAVDGDRAADERDARLVALERELAELRALLSEGDRRLRVLELELRAVARRERPVTAPPASVREIGAAAAPRRQPVPRPAPPPRPPRREIDWSQLLGARALAWAGGIVTSLGIVFLYVLAANRGWIGPVARVATGAAASAVLFGAGFWLRRRFGTTYAALAAAGAGIVGGYATLLASVALYSLLPAWAALLVAGGIGAVGVATALRWSAETVAALGLVGAILVPLVGVLDLGWTVLGTAFVLVVLVAAVTVAVLRGWGGVLAAAAVASAPQIAALVVDRADADVPLVALAALFSVAYVAAAAGWAGRREALDALSASLALVGAGVASLGAQVLFEGASRGVALLAAAAALALAAAAVLLRERERARDLSALLAALALALGAVGLAQIASGQTLAIAWAAQAAVLAWLARRLDEERYQLGALAYLALAAGHALVIDAPPGSAFARAVADPGTGIPAVLAVGAASAAAALLARPWEPRRGEARGVLAPLAPAFASLRASQRRLRVLFSATAVVAALYALSLGILELAQRLGSDVTVAFERGHAVVTATWAALTLAALVVALRRGVRPAALGALWAYLGVFLKVLLLDSAATASTPRALGALAAAASLLAAATVWQRLAVEGARLDRVSVGLLAGSVALGVPGGLDLLDRPLGPIHADVVALVALAAAYGGLATAMFRRERDLSSSATAVALALGAAAAAVQLDGSWLVLVWAAAAAALAVLSQSTHELRLLFASGVYLALALVHALVLDAPPRDLFAAQAEPGAGVPALLAAAGAGIAFAAASVVRRAPAPPEGDDPLGTRALAFGLEARLPSWRASALAGSALVAVHAVSLSVLELFQRLPAGGVETSFQRGHTAVSAFWAVLALALLYAGLVRRQDRLRNAGLMLFAATLVKIFVYDLAALSPVARALSFLAVGALLLAAGFFYQRLSGRADGREASAQ